MINYQSSGKRTAANLAAGKLKIDVLDPSLANGCVTPTLPGINWIPIKPATNSAFCAALIQKMIADKTFDAEAMSFTNQKAALAAGYAAFCNGSFLVIDDENHPNYKKLMRPADAGINAPEKLDKDGKPVDQFVCIDAETNQPAITDNCSKGVLDFGGEVNGVKVRTGFAILTESVNEYTIEEYSEITGVSVEDIERIAKEFTSHGQKVSVCHKGGECASVHGVDCMVGANMLHMMMGTNQMIGGNAPNSPSPTTAGKGARYDLATVADKPKITAQAISRTSKAWDKTDEYKNRVAAGETDPKPKMPWFPLGSSSDSQALMSIVNQYPYQCKILTSWMVNTIQATPGAMRDEVIERLCDPEILPLHIACDVFVGEHAQYADYIVPDVTPYESYGLPTPGTTWVGYGTTVRWPVKTPESVQLEDGRYASWEAFLCDVAEAIDLPGFGEGAIKDTAGNAWPLHDAGDFYLKAIANLAYANDPVADISDEEAHLQGLDALPEDMKACVTDEEWPKVLNVLSRGGRYWPIEYVREPDGIHCMGYEKDHQTFIYSEKRATYKNCYSGEGTWPVLHYTRERLSDMSYTEDMFSREEYPFLNSEHKPRFRTVSMLSNSPIMRGICDHNYIEMNREDAAELGIKDGDRVRCITPMGDVSEGEAMVRAGQAKGAFAIAFGYEHINYGAQDIEIDGKLTPGNPAIAAGVRTHQMLDPLVSKDGVLSIYSENEAASPGRVGGMWKIEKA